MDIRWHVFAAAFAQRIEMREVSGEPVTEAHEDQAYAHAESVAGRAAAAHERATGVREPSASVLQARIDHALSNLEFRNFFGRYRISDADAAMYLDQVVARLRGE